MHPPGCLARASAPYTARRCTIVDVDTAHHSPTTLPECTEHLHHWLSTTVEFSGLKATEVTDTLSAAIRRWGHSNGWMTNTEVPSTARRHSGSGPGVAHYGYLDLVFDRWGEESVVVEIDRGNKQWSLEKLTAEAARGRVSIWVRWGRQPPQVPDGVGLVYLPVVLHSGTPRTYSYSPRLRARA